MIFDFINFSGFLTWFNLKCSKHIVRGIIYGISVGAIVSIAPGVSLDEGVRYGFTRVLTDGLQYLGRVFINEGIVNPSKNIYKMSKNLIKDVYNGANILYNKIKDIKFPGK